MAIELVKATQLNLTSAINYSTTIDWTPGANPLELVFLHSTATVIGGTPTLNGSNMTLISTANNASGTTGCLVQAWYHNSPATGAVNITIPNSGGVEFRLMGLSLSGVHQTSAIKAVNTTAAVSCVAVLPITSCNTAGGYLVAGITHQGAAAAKARNYNVAYENDEGAWNDALWYGAAATASSTFTFANASCDLWCGIAVSLEPAPALSTIMCAPKFIKCTS